MIDFKTHIDIAMVLTHLVIHLY